MGMSDWLRKYFSEHWQFVVSGFLYFTGKDLLGASHDNYWVQQSGLWCMDIAIYVMGFKAVAATVTEDRERPK